MLLPTASIILNLGVVVDLLIVDKLQKFSSETVLMIFSVDVVVIVVVDVVVEV